MTRCLLICFLGLAIASVFFVIMILFEEKLEDAPSFIRDAKYKSRISEQNVQRDEEMEVI